MWDFNLWLLADAEPFNTITLGNGISAVISLIGILIAYWKLSRERRQNETTQIERHAKNSASLDMLIGFHAAQTTINTKRDEQVSELKEQTAVLKEIAKGLARRLEMMENRSKFERHTS